jgi:2-polyprenyl-3-methyl-5-hydroxy-6-metoxy-1,4-benzoquinol methylase
MDGISINKIPCSDGIARKLKASFSMLSRYNPPFVADAEKGISKLLGVRDFDDLKKGVFFLHEEFREAVKQGNEPLSKKILFSPYFRPIDYNTDPIIFAGIHAAISEFIGLDALKGKNVLQIAPNWGPYMHFLRNKYGANTFGIDKNEAAVEYAKKGGLNFIVGDASNMDSYHDDSFDIAVSYNFLDSAYMSMLFHEKTTQFMGKILTEVHRVLKPGGYFFSLDEAIETIAPAFKLFNSFARINSPFPHPNSILKK